MSGLIASILSVRGGGRHHGRTAGHSPPAEFFLQVKILPFCYNIALEKATPYRSRVRNLGLDGDDRTGQEADTPRRLPNHRAFANSGIVVQAFGDLGLGHDNKEAIPPSAPRAWTRGRRRTREAIFP
ncbi:MAG: hypothetical protein Kilf2KO_07010 [Rhodospirillales bacterium]